MAHPSDQQHQQSGETMHAMASMVKSLVGVAVAAVLAIGAVAATPAEPAAAATDTSCRVVNATRGSTHRSLAAAVKAARNKNKLLVKGTCRGATKVIGKRLVIEGRWTKKKGAPTLRSNGKDPVLTLMGDGTTVSLKKLIVRGNPTRVLKSSGAGIKVNYADGGVLKLIDVKVRDFRTKSSGGCIANFEGRVELWGKTIVTGCTATSGLGGGIHNESGKLLVAGQSVIKGNRAKWGGGVAGSGMFSVVTVRSGAAITGNRATYQGGGMYSISSSSTILGGDAVISSNSADSDGGGIMVEGDETDIKLGGNSRVTGNSAGLGGGGVKFKGRTMTMASGSTITGNTAVQGGGLSSAGWTTLVGVVCTPDAGANVSGNSPDDCHRG